MIRTLVIDDHALFREGLARLLAAEADIEVVGHCSTLTEAFSLLVAVAVDVVLLDYDLGSERGTEFVSGISILKGHPKILIVTAGMPERDARWALEHGVMNVLLKQSDPRELVTAIRKAVDPGSSVDTELLLQSLPVQGNVYEFQKISDQMLTRRQGTALRGILDGLSNKEIADQMNISESSVKAILQEESAQ